MTAEQRWAALVESMLAQGAATYGSDGPQRAFGSTSLKTDGKIFAMLVKDRLVVKLDRRRVDELVEAGEGRRFDPGHGRLQKEWLHVDSPLDDQWLELATEAEAYVARRRQKPADQDV
jgi:TfoX/Sxy family transcriptional regulator of competence genes